MRNELVYEIEKFFFKDVVFDVVVVDKVVVAM
ncbi:hypothetical protein QG37_00590 [Candidozyma auris]|uniref:Uncharacterized protein n=1 Tax=Candidozyma auris TaxID=498019 RepID=A0A0L0P7W8_CANAR|nr:hypothetical protein QG37_00590 [[Candida] auris]